MKILAIVEDLRINKSSCGIISNNILSCLIKGEHEIFCLYDYADYKDFSWLKHKNIEFKEINKTEKNPFLNKMMIKIPKINGILAYIFGFNYFELNKINIWKDSINLQLNENSNYDLILLLGTGNSILNYFAFENISTKIPFLVIYHDPYPELQYPHPYKHKFTLIGKFKAKRSDNVIKKAKIVGFPSQRLYEWMTHFHPILKQKSIILPHPNSDLKNLPTAPLDETVFLDKGKFNILHTGSLLGPRNPLFLMEAFQKFINSSTEKKELTRLTIIGGISNSNEIAKVEVSSRIENPIRVIKERISYKKSIELLKEADVLLILEAISKDSPFMPGKLSDYIMANKTIMALTPVNSEVSRLLGNNYQYKTETDNVEGIFLILENLWLKWKSNSLNNTENPLKDYVSEIYWNKEFLKAVQKT